MKKILFLTGTRADYGKIKALIKCVETSEKLEAYIFVCGMHLIEQFGYTFNEIIKDNYTNTYIAYGLEYIGDMSLDAANVISHLTGYIKKIKPDMIVVHGDRIDALAGALVGVLNNIIVSHIEGGEISGTIDESIRHSISKLAHLHFVSNKDAKKRLIQMGEKNNNIYIIGSPDIDIMVSKNLPKYKAVKQYYDISFNKYAIFMYHPITTEYNFTQENIVKVINALKLSKKNYIVIYPNNDMGSEFIISELKKLEENKKFRIFPSIRFEYFLTIMKHAEFVIGNSSAGVREACIYGVPSVDIGTRQNGRYSKITSENVVHTTENTQNILTAINNVHLHKLKSFSFGEGNSKELFTSILENFDWNFNVQKKFIDIGENL